MHNNHGNMLEVQFKLAKERVSALDLKGEQTEFTEDEVAERKK